MRRAILLILIAFGLTGPAWLTLRADTAHTDISVSTSAGDLRVRTTSEGTSVTATDAARAAFTTLTDPGKPALPVRVVNVLLPAGHRFERVAATPADPTTLAHGVVLTSRPAPAPVPDAPTVSAPTPAPALAPDDRPGTFPSEFVRYLGTGRWHGYDIASFAVFPVRVEGDDVVQYRNVALRVETAAAAGTLDVRAKRSTPPTVAAIDAALRGAVVNPEAAAGYAPIAARAQAGPFAPTVAPSLEGSPVEYVIVTTAALAAEFDTLATWKTAKGIPTVVRTVEWVEANYRRGTDRAETIRYFLEDAYTKWGIKWVLIGADTPDIPTRYLYSAYYYGGSLIPSDLYFASLDGNFNADGDTRFGEQPDDAPDLYPELCVGRLPVSTTAAAHTVVSKIMAYETPVDPTYTDKVLYLAEVLFPAPWSPPATIQQNGADIADYLHAIYSASPSRRVTRAYETEWLFPGSVHESRANTIDSLNAGYNQVFQIGHGYRFNMHVGDDNFAIPDADALNHPNRCFNLFMLNCTAAAYDYDSLGEHLLRNPSGGAVSILGAANSAFADVSAYYMEAYVDQLYDQHVVHIGETLNLGRAVRTPFAEMGDNADLWTHYIYALLSDPELGMWTAEARTPIVTHPATVPAGINTVVVQVFVDGLPRANAAVCLWKDGEDYQTALTNGSGVASFNFNTPTAGTIRVVATARDMARYEGAIAVTAAAGAMLKVESLIIDDDQTGGTIGNNNGVIDAGETVDLRPAVRNTGGAGSPAVTATLTTSTPGITIMDATAAVPSIAPGGLVNASDSWRVQVATNVADETAAGFSATLTNGASSWTSPFAKVVHAPVLEVVGLRRSDQVPIGNGDGIITNGEQFLLFATLKNYGTGSADGINAGLHKLDGGTTLYDSVSTYVSLGHLASGENTVAFRMSEANVSIPNSLKLTVVYSYFRFLNHTFELRAPLPPVIQALDPSLGVDKMQVTWTPGASTDVKGYHVYRSTSASGPFTRASSDVIVHTVFTDVGLAPSTRYYYKVVTIDQSGNEGALSAAASASTNPPQLTGWPNQLPEPSANSPVIGDIDSDGGLEVVVGNDRLYAWNANGSEVIDGDQQGITWGVLSPLGDDFIGPAALAKLDGNFGLDIVAATYTSKQVFCFRADGTVLPGWPHSTIDVVRAGVAVGDLDGDDSLEIVAIDQDAYLYAWHANGTEVIDGDSNPATNGVFKRLPDTSQWQYQMPALADIDGDNKDEIIIGTQDMKVYVLNEDGSNVPGWPFSLPNYAGGGVAVGDIDNNGDLEIVVTTRNTGETYALNHNATQMWLRWLPTNLFFNPSPALADITGDGKLETFIASSNGRLYAITYTGADAPGWPVYYSTKTYTESSPVIADVTGDGSLDVLLGDEGKFINGWSSTGVPLDGFPLVTTDAVRGTPAVTDLDRDGDVEIVAVGYDKSVYVWGLTVAYNPAKMPWPMFKANTHRNGRYGFVVPTAVTDGDGRVRNLRLGQNHPNPFNPTTSIDYEIPDGPAERVVITIYDVTGARVRTLADRVTKPGRYVAVWDGRDNAGQPVGSGVYFYRLSTTQRTLTRKMVLLK